MKVEKTSSYFVNIYIKNNGEKFIRRKKRPLVQEHKKKKYVNKYPRILPLRYLNILLSQTNIKYPKILKNHFKYIDEEFIKNESYINDDVISIISDYIVEMSKIDYSKVKKIY